MKTLPKFTLVILCLFGLTTVLQAQVPQLINYQGRVVVGTTNFDGSGQFKFALVNAAGTAYWTNDGTHLDGTEPTAAVALPVTKGLYSVGLGDNALTNMTALPGTVFTNSDVRLRVWFNDGTHGFQPLTPDQRLGSVGYAFMADNIKDGAIISTKLANGAVGTTQLASGAVTNANIATGAVSGMQLAPGLTLAGTTTGTFSGSLNGNATNFTGSLTGDVTGTQGATSIAPATVTGKPLTGFSSTTGTITASDTVLSAINKLNGNDALKAPLASPSFTGTVSVPAVNLPATTSATNGVIEMAGTPILSAKGTQNTFLGNGAGNFTLTGSQNTAAGASAFANNTSGTGNTAAGVSSLAANTIGFNNTATGFQALGSNTTASNNVATGQGALLANTTGANNTATGTSALRNNNGSSNTATGTSALTNNTSGANNIALGNNAGQTITTGSNNIDVGSDAATAAESNTIRIGTAQTDTFLTGVIHGNGSGLTGISASGFSGSLTGDVTGTQGSTVVATVNGVTAANVASGANVANAATNANTTSTIVKRDASGNFNAGTITASLNGNATNFTGSLTGDVTGTQAATVVATVGGVTAVNVASGANLANAATDVNTVNAIVKRDASGNFSAGTVNAPVINIPATTSAANGVIQMAGSPILSAPGPGSGNLFLGRFAGNFSSTGVGDNTGVGENVLPAVTTGAQNTAVGTVALFHTSTGSYNTALGVSALDFNNTGASNTATGAHALFQNTFGGNNTAVGVDTLIANTGGDSSTAVGYQALTNVGSGDNNIGLGAGAGQSLTSGSNNIYIGNDGVASESNIIRIGTAQTDTFLTGVIHGNGSGLTGISASAVTGTITGAQIANGAVSSAQLASGAVGSTALASGAVAAGNIATGAVTTTKIANGAVTGTQLASGLTLAGTTTGTFSGNGSSLTSLNASNITTGTLPVAQLPATVALRTGGNTFTGLQTFSGDGSMEHTQAATAGAASFMEFDDSTGGSVFRGIYGSDGPTFSGASNQFTIATWTNSPLAFYTNQVRRMTIATDGTVGIGTTAGHGALEIGFIGGSYTNSGGAGFNSSSVGQPLGSLNTGTFPSAVYANGSVITTSIFGAISDARVKNIIGRSDAARDLSTLLGIEITDYRYKDVIAHGDAPFKKVIAQQVEKVFPQAVNRQTGEVPDIYKLATVKDGWIALATDLKKGERVKLITDEAQGVYEVLEVQGGAFRTDFKSATDKVFVYGREVKDFRNVDYDAIAMLNVSATQQMQKEIESLKANQKQVATLRDENATLRYENAANAKRLATLETRDKEREARLARIEMSIPPAQAVSNTIAATKAGEQ